MNNNLANLAYANGLQSGHTEQGDSRPQEA